MLMTSKPNIELGSGTFSGSPVGSTTGGLGGSGGRGGGGVPMVSKPNFKRNASSRVFSPVA